MNESSWTMVAQVPLSQNLDNLVSQLQRRGIQHKVVVDDLRQSVWIEDPEHIPLVDELLRRHSKPSRPSNPWFDANQKVKKSTSGPKFGGLKSLIREFPVVMYSILLSALGAVLVYLDQGLGLNYSLVGKFTFQQMVPFVLSPMESISQGEFWRPLTPIFLHFGVVHLAFNSMCLWLFGARIERLLGGRRLLWIILVTGLVGNLAQYLWQGPSLFGGMSGVAFGLVGFVWVRHQFAPHELTELPQVLVFMMMLSLFLGISGALDAFVGGGIANAAHLGGLLSGVILGWFSAQAARGRR